MLTLPALRRLCVRRLFEYGGGVLIIFVVVAGATALGWVAPSLSLWAAIADLFAQFLPHVALGGLTLAAVALARSQPRLALAFAVGAALTLIPTLPWVTPWRIVPGVGTTVSAMGPGSARSLKVRFANIYYLNRDVAAMTALFADPTVEVVALVEATAEVQALLAPYAGDWPYRLGCAKPGACANIVYSRRPLTADSRIVSFAQPIGFHALEAWVTRDGASPLRLVVAHFARGLPYGGYKLAAQQADALAALIGPAARGALVVGDFNGAPWARTVRRVTDPTGLIAAPGVEGTWPSDLPLPLRLPLDQALLSPDLVPGAVRAVGPSFGSDHLSLLLTLPEGAAP